MLSQIFPQRSSFLGFDRVFKDRRGLKQRKRGIEREEVPEIVEQ